MKLTGRRIHFSGSADVECDEKKLSYLHGLIRELTLVLLREGATFVLPFSGEPLLAGRTDGPSIIFDWTIAEAILDELKSGRVQGFHSTAGHLIETIITTKTDSQIPPSRRATYDELCSSNAVSKTVLTPGWSAGAIRRQKLAQAADILIGAGGGQGVEHLAMEFSGRGKPIIPLDINVGSSMRDGSGGAARLFDRALANPSDFFSVNSGYSPVTLLDSTRTRDGQVEIAKVTSDLMALMHALTPPRVFYVRLLNPSVPEFDNVEKFFRSTVDTAIREMGYEPLEMGRGKNEFAWMNQAIFDSLHHSSVVFVDLTALRQNCFMEMGYGLGNKQRVIVSAHKSTKISFDAFALEAFQWAETDDPSEQIAKFKKHWERNFNMPGLVKPKEAK